MPYSAQGTPLMHCQLSHVSNHFAVISWATICCLLTKVSNFSHTCDKTTLHAVTHANTHTRCTHTRDRHTYREHTSGIISTCTTRTCTSIDNFDHIATSNGLRFAAPYSPLAITSFPAPPFRSASALPLFFCNSQRKFCSNRNFLLPVVVNN